MTHKSLNKNIEGYTFDKYIFKMDSSMLKGQNGTNETKLLLQIAFFVPVFLDPIRLNKMSQKLRFKILSKIESNFCKMMKQI